MAKEFNVTKPTISDAVRVLEKKALIKKDSSSIDSRSYSIVLTTTGKEMIVETEHFANPLAEQLEAMDTVDQVHLFDTISNLIYQLNRTGILSVQRTCYACKFYKPNKGKAYCSLLEKELLNTDIRLDCPEFEEN